MRTMAAEFEGRNDYRSFTDEENEGKSTVVAIESIELAEEGDLLLVRVEGSHFLWKMVRRIVGVLVHVGAGTLTVDEATTFLKEESDVPPKMTAPASGLFLERVYYARGARRPPLRPCIDVRFPR
jgi:tRNA pseudouridine38-40 synthase